MAYGANNDGTTRNGYVKLNATPVWQASWSGRFPNLRGVNVILVDPFECSVREVRRFDTFGNAHGASWLRSYLMKVNRGTITVGVSADEPTRYLVSALPTLREMGANVANVRSKGAFAFVAQKGFPPKTVLRKSLDQADSSANQPQFNATVTGV